jgi:hypothetical protein
VCYDTCKVSPRQVSGRSMRDDFRDTIGPGKVVRRHLKRPSELTDPNPSITSLPESSRDPAYRAATGTDCATTGNTSYNMSKDMSGAYQRLHGQYKAWTAVPPVPEVCPICCCCCTSPLSCLPRCLSCTSRPHPSRGIQAQLQQAKVQQAPDHAPAPCARRGRSF